MKKQKLFAILCFKHGESIGILSYGPSPRDQQAAVCESKISMKRIFAEMKANVSSAIRLDSDMGEGFRLIEFIQNSVVDEYFPEQNQLDSEN